MTDSVNIRELVLELLLRITRDGEYSHIAINAVLSKYQYLEKRERSFVTREAEGTLEHMIELDYIINQFSKTKVNKMKPVIRCLLRGSVYELKYMDNVPASATCNESVKLARKKGFSNLTGFVNGVLRNISRNLDQITYPDEKKDLAASLSVRYSMPEWMIKKWLKDYDKETVMAMLAGFLQEAPLTIRTNLTKITPKDLAVRLQKEGLSVQQDEVLPYAFHITGGLDYLYSLPSFQEGLFYVQDLSSMQVAEIAAPKQGDQVIDVCAAPGGKSIHIAEKLNGTGHVQARDLTEYKVGLILENIARCRVENVDAVCQDASVLTEEDIDRADIVIADLPCSGLGVMRKKKDIRYKMTEEKQEELVKIQRDILAVVHQYVKPGGKLVYSTCTVNRAENEENVAWFLAQYPQFTCDYKKQILPDETGCDGFFIARMIREE
ncbi:MAG: 16S rRNA (cytosine(967)-C(5))-methyltransferase RsmB [Lachnospiraceae bacterium]|nr:16S rRNA (cytosine(967)-C(5))-methyltransferase RsmB [Lachnospiraceae bacterium]